MSDLADAAVAPAEGPGAILRRGREARGLGVDDVAAALKLTPRQIRAIEAEDFASLNGKTFARGFVRNYARVLELDPAPLLAVLDQRLGEGDVRLLPPSNARGEMPVADAPRGLGRSLAVLAVVVLAGVVTLLAYERYTSPALRPAAAKPVSPTPPAVVGPPAAVAPPAAVTLEAVPATGAAGAVPTAVETVPGVVVAVAPPPGERRLEFRFEQESWVEVKDGEGHVLLSRVNPAGSTQVVEGKPPFALVIGNAPHVSLSYGDTQVDLRPHTAVSVARLSLD